MYAEHSIHYDNLDSYFLGFGVWDDSVCWGWDETLRLFDDLEITPVRTLYRGSWEEFYSWRFNLIENWNVGAFEGFVVRVVKPFTYEEFQTHCAKWVRKDHIQTDQHWMAKAVVPNGLKEW